MCICLTQVFTLIKIAVVLTMQSIMDDLLSTCIKELSHWIFSHLTLDCNPCAPLPAPSCRVPTLFFGSFIYFCNSKFLFFYFATLLFLPIIMSGAYDGFKISWLCYFHQFYSFSGKMAWLQITLCSNSGGEYLALYIYHTNKQNWYFESCHRHIV